MLIECGYCGAPLDTSPNRRVAKCRYCGSSNNVSQARALAQATPSGWHPPEEWRPPAHVPADSSQLLAYRRGNLRVGLVASALVLVLVAGLGVGGFALLGARSEARARRDIQLAIQRAEQAVQQQLQGLGGSAALAQDRGAAATTSPSPATLGSESLFTGTRAAELAKMYRAHLGGQPVRVLELALYPSYAFLEAQDPKAPKNVDRYAFRDGRIGEAEAVRLSFVHGKLESNLFDLDEVALDKLPQLIKTTLTELGYEKGEVSHVLVERNLPFTKNVVVRVYVSGPRDSGRIDFTADGKVQQVFK